MASSPNIISFLFLFAFFSMQIHAREFFSKIPSVNNNERKTTTIPDTIGQEHETFIPETQKSSLPYREEQTFGKQEQEPRFIPETQNGYGLYGHGSGQLPPSTTTTTKETYEPYVTPVRYHPDEPYNSIPASYNNNNKNTYYYNKNSYETEQENFGKARFTEKGWSTEENKNNNYYNGYNNGEKQGMSDTRYLENGRYYYDVKNENNYYPNQYENSRGVASRNEYNENRYNNMGRYNQNQEEFEENEEVFEP
ncbi:protein E6-like [Durio zibethinus]|uniref:Protein E6-like n=1 Tax=Durio zibethinus TaxID=66656 RepID=A0A6P5X7E6_DURZI|nr:protein E6-like [Durio zibethinus]